VNYKPVAGNFLLTHLTYNLFTVCWDWAIVSTAVPKLARGHQESGYCEGAWPTHPRLGPCTAACQSGTTSM